MKPLLALCLFWLASIAPSFGLEQTHAMRSAVHAFSTGDFLEAIVQARRAESAEGYAYAARAGLVYADFVSPKDARLEMVVEAEADARRAIALAPELAEGHLQLAIALGFRARIGGHMSAHFEGLADEAKRHLDFVIASEADNPWAHALLGGWHLEISEAGGFLGRTIYGADVDTGIEEYERALDLKPDDLVVRAQCALQLTALGTADHRRRAQELLANVVVPDSPDALQSFTLNRLRTLQAALDRGDESEILQVVVAQKGMAEHELPSTEKAPSSLQIRPSVGQSR
jgi:tetratricopeptide (TPR) repeat protein